MIIIFNGNLEFKDKNIPKTILGHAPFIAEDYFGHRSRIYQLDLMNNPHNIADVIIESYNQGVRAINLVNKKPLLKAYDIACEEGCEMKVIATIGKSDVDYLMKRKAGSASMLKSAKEFAVFCANITKD